MIARCQKQAFIDISDSLLLIKGSFEMTALDMTEYFYTCSLIIVRS